MLLKHETLFTMREATQVILQRHKVLRLPRKMALMINPLEAWNAIYNARGSTRHPPTSPNAAPATKNTSHDQSSWSMKRYLQCAKQHKAPSNVTKCYACHEKYLSWSILLKHETLFTMRKAAQGILQRDQMLRLPSKMSLQTRRQFGWKLMKCYFHCVTDASMIRAWSETDPTIKTQAANPPRNRGYFSR